MRSRAVGVATVALFIARGTRYEAEVQSGLAHSHLVPRPSYLSF
jgi:hypothetical protein